MLLASALLSASLADAQVVRGRVSERTTAAPLGGVLIELLTVTAGAPGVAVASALSDPAGGYAVRGPGPGRYVVTAKRIGVRRFVSDAFDIAEGETVARDLALDALLYQLPEVVITGMASCDANAHDGDRVASLWEEARTALLATQISLRDQLFAARVTRYVRQLDPRSKRVLEETRSEAAGVVSRPFSAVDAESLSTLGFWQARPDGRVTYHGPDADVLLADAFLRDHCFREARGGRNRRGLVGVGFRPLPHRTLPDIVGTVWLDEKTFELRFVEFTYSRVHLSADSADIGGEVHFARLRGGAWIIRRWFIRLPVDARPAEPLTTEQTAAPWVLVRPRALRLREEGGEVAAEEQLRRPLGPAFQ